MKALIAMSGGVDSSVAAFLVKNKGYDCIGATMRLFDNELIGEDKDSTCCSLDDVEDARQVANRLGIPFYVFNFSGNFRKAVIDRFVSAYINGKTPNPCIDCNRYIKWKQLFSRMKELGADYVVTGHYARIEHTAGGKYLLKKGKDASKDQSYVLYNMTQEQLSHTLLPIGEFSKDEIRSIAKENGFMNADKPDSQDICFVPDGDYAVFIERYTGKKTKCGDFIDINGNKIGTHYGVERYTIGQRKGLGVAFGKPMFVCSKDARNNTVTLSGEDNLFSSVCLAEDFNFISGEAPKEPLSITAKTRYSQKEQPATVFPPENGIVRIEFSSPQRAITPGQAVVIYNGDIVLGGGTII